MGWSNGGWGRWDQAGREWGSWGRWRGGGTGSDFSDAEAQALHRELSVAGGSKGTFAGARGRALAEAAGAAAAAAARCWAGPELARAAVVAAVCSVLAEEPRRRRRRRRRERDAGEVPGSPAAADIQFVGSGCSSRGSAGSSDGDESVRGGRGSAPAEQGVLRTDHLQAQEAGRPERERTAPPNRGLDERFAQVARLGKRMEELGSRRAPGGGGQHSVPAGVRQLVGKGAARACSQQVSAPPRNALVLCGAAKPLD